MSEKHFKKKSHSEISSALSHTPQSMLISGLSNPISFSKHMLIM